MSLVSFPHIFNIEFVLDETVSMLGSHENQPYWNCNLFSLTQCIRYKQAYQVLLGDDKRLWNIYSWASFLVHLLLYYTSSGSGSCSPMFLDQIFVNGVLNQKSHQWPTMLGFTKWCSSKETFGGSSSSRSIINFFWCSSGETLWCFFSDLLFCLFLIQAKTIYWTLIEQVVSGGVASARAA